mmetsp:Transcript_42212/g.126270  ORF Transcript_42212/g.126270 Transcript_42212/m.126270 type:complete len:109 (-) Transcript_42212:330-656(-)
MLSQRPGQPAAVSSRTVAMREWHLSGKPLWSRGQHWRFVGCSPPGHAAREAAAVEAGNSGPGMSLQAASASRVQNAGPEMTPLVAALMILDFKSPIQHCPLDWKKAKW